MTYFLKSALHCLQKLVGVYNETLHFAFTNTLVIVLMFQRFLESGWYPKLLPIILDMAFLPWLLTYRWSDNTYALKKKLFTIFNISKIPCFFTIIFLKIKIGWISQILAKICEIFMIVRILLVQAIFWSFNLLRCLAVIIFCKWFFNVFILIVLNPNPNKKAQPLILFKYKTNFKFYLQFCNLTSRLRLNFLSVLFYWFNLIFI